jgi:dTDP-4-amino-4,6-dideoxygalactose transaminase
LFLLGTHNTRISGHADIFQDCGDILFSMESTPAVQTSRPSLAEAEQEAILRVLATGYLGMGPEVRAFESELGNYLGRGAVCTNTGTSALHLGVSALDLPEGAEVLVPSLTFVASFQAVAAAGAKPVACDVSSSSGLLDLEDARRRITPRTRAVMPVHYAGYPGDTAALYEFARAHRLRVVEDAAHAFGTRTAAGLVGSSGDVVCFSFDPIKNITAGLGGAVVSGDPKVLAAVRRMRALGMERVTAADGEPDVEVSGPGWRYEMSDIMAAMGRVQLARFETELKPHRLALAAEYRARLAGCPNLTLLDSSAHVVPHIFVVRIEASRRGGARAALRQAGFETLVHYKPAHQFAAFKAHGLPASELLFRELLSLPMHGAVTLAHVRSISEVLGTALG